ncbi:hypothetical protein MRX96_013855 [Rhipicephalus microplus]
MKAYCLAIRTFPFPLPRLARVEAVLLRQLTTGSLPSPALMHRMYPETYPTDKCKAAPRLEAAIVRCSSSTECCQEFPAADPDRSGWNPTLQVPDSASVFDLKIPPPDLRPEIRPSRSSSEDIEALNPIVLDTTEPYQTTIMLSHADTRLPRNVSFEPRYLATLRPLPSRTCRGPALLLFPPSIRCLHMTVRQKPPARLRLGVLLCMKTESLNKACSHPYHGTETQASDIFVQVRDIAQGIKGNAGLSYTPDSVPVDGPNPKASTFPGRRLDLSAGLTESILLES